jgi:hypothetical protein
MNSNRDKTLKLRTQSIRTLTAAELRVAHGGVTDSGCGNSKTSCDATKAIVFAKR